MKIWIGICLLWFVGRVAFAGPHAELYAPKVINFTALGQALEEGKAHRVEHAYQHLDFTTSITSLIKRYQTPEELMRGPLSPDVLPVPRSSVYLTNYETKVYVTLMQREFYPQVRVIYDVTEDLRAAVSERGYVLNHDERKAAQENCFRQGDFSKRCVIEKALRDALTEEVEASLEKNEILASSQKIVDSLMDLLAKENGASVIHNENFHSDGAAFWLEKKDPAHMLAQCLELGGKFDAEKLASGDHCRKVFLKNFLEKENMNASMKESVLRQILGPFSLLRRLQNSLLEGPMKNKPYCFPSRHYDSCLTRKIKEDLSEWSDDSAFRGADRASLIRALVKNWD